MRTVPQSKCTNFIDVFKGFEWVHKLLAWTKGSEMAVVEWNTSFKCVLTVYT